MYDCKVKRKNMTDDPLISRTYEDFRNLYFRLCYKFPSIGENFWLIRALTIIIAGIPNLGRSRFLVRSNIQRVASERFIELQHFLQTLFILPPEISHVINLCYSYLFGDILVWFDLQFLPSHSAGHRKEWRGSRKAR